ncbi:hypothetical protein ABL78_5525 [Leptomonas seymouri]|uniref:Uncharacterized protein n=1 Tax=Leptomonas seymouri TaxID=5684 RepID=A0A0N1PAX1_LEPSE|nr:hypothetical protein ABL78_5525 [Leptomonas seymouri]|eukprot:KPI85435.1 hypothetical protein ABL78_5525 [Leptomonas seymouri]
MADSELSEIILTEAARCARGRLDSEASIRLIRYLSDANRRNHVYKCCLDLAQDPGRRQRIMMLLRSYVNSFPPSLSCLRAIEAFCHLHSTADVSQELLKLTEALLREAPLEGLATRVTRSSRFGYASEFALQPDIPSAAPSAVTSPASGAANSSMNCNNSSSNSSDANDHVPVTTVLEKKWMDVSVKKNESQKCYVDVVYRRVWCQPYLVQFPLLCLESTVERQLKFMCTFSANYKTNRNVAQATLFFIKQLCDGYVSKLPLQDAALQFRSVTICYVPMLLDMMESDYLCVRNHVYDFILNLGVHLQLVDPAGVYPGCTEALEQELVWLLLTVTNRQAVLKVSDETTWTAAAKCILAVMPPAYQHLTDCRVLFQILQLPGLWEVHPEAFSMLAMAFARSLLQHKGVDVPATENLAIDEAELAKLGNAAVPAILTVYRHSITPGSRKALFQLLLAYAARRQGLQSGKYSGRVAGQVLSMEARGGTLRDLMSVDFFWYLMPLLFYLSENVQRELPRRIADGLVKSDFDGTTKSWSVVLPLTDQMLEILADDAELPSHAQARFKAMEELRRKDEGAFITALQDLLNEVAETVPQLVEEQAGWSECKVHSAAWRLAFVSLRWSSRYLPEEKHRLLTEKLARNLVDYKDERGRTRNRARMGHMCTYLLSSLAVLCRTSARRDIVTFRVVLEVLLFDREDSIDVRTAMALYYRLMENICEPSKQGRYALHTSQDTSDISVMILREKSLRIPVAAARLVSVRVLWGLYWSLVLSQEMSVCRARHVLVLMLTHCCTERSGVEVRTWRTVLADPYPPVALLAAEKILYLSRVEEKPAAAAVAAADASADIARNTYHEATRILEKGLAGKRGKQPVGFGLLHDGNFREGERGERPLMKALREMALS